MTESKDPDLENATAALIRAAKQARKVAKQTNTAIIIRRDGKLVRELPAETNNTEPTQTTRT